MKSSRTKTLKPACLHARHTSLYKQTFHSKHVKIHLHCCVVSGDSRKSESPLLVNRYTAIHQHLRVSSPQDGNDHKSDEETTKEKRQDGG